MLPVITVIIPMYNAQDSIIRALDSVFKQTYTGPFEIIVVNDGSTDNSQGIVNDYIDSNKIRNLFLVNKENGGVSSARNAGLIMSKGDFIAFLDADDEWLPDKIDIQLKVFQKFNNVFLVGSNINRKKIDHFYFKKFNHVTQISVNNLVFKNFFQPSTVMIKRKVIEDIGLFPADQRYAEEGNFFIKAAARFTCVLINEKQVNYGYEKPSFGGSGLSGNLQEMQKGEILNLNFAYRNGYINFFVFFIAYLYSYLKYIRRILIVKFRSLKPN